MITTIYLETISKMDLHMSSLPVVCYILPKPMVR